MGTDIVPYGVPFDTSIMAGRISKASIAMYRRDFKAYLEFAETLEQAVNAITLARWITVLSQDDQTYSPNTINRMVSAVKRLMREAAIQGYISHETAESFKHIDGVSVAALKEKLRKHNKVKIEPGLMRKIIDSFDTSTLVGLRNRAMFTALASSGLRVKELATLQQDQIIQRGKGYLLVIHAEQGKNLIEDREANISREAVEAIDEWIDARLIESPYIFTSFEIRGDSKPLAKAISPVGAWKVIRRVFYNNGALNVKPHDLRRFVITQLAKDDIRKAQKAAGHKRIETTTKYDLNEIEVGATDNLF